MLRRSFGEDLHNIDSDKQRDDIVNDDVWKLAAAGEMKAAMEKMITRYEGLENQRQEQDWGMLEDVE